MTTFKPVNEFPLLERYKKKFPITEGTIFAYNNIIYADTFVPDHLVIHETEHFKQQEKYGLDEWVDKYLEDDELRLEMEVQAYRKQLNSIKDRNERNQISQPAPF